MKTSIFSVTLLSVLASAAPHLPISSSGTVNLMVGNDARVSSIVTIPFNVLFDASAIEKGTNIYVISGTGLDIPDTSIACQAFSDPSGKTPLGPIFGTSLPGAQLSPGNYAVKVNSIFCSSTTALESQIAESTPAPALLHQGLKVRRATLTARIQLNFEDEGAAQGEVPLNNSVFPIRGNFATGTAINGFISSAPKGVNINRITCQAYKDAKAKQKLGKPFSGNQSGIFSTNGRPVTIGALKCKIV